MRAPSLPECGQVLCVSHGRLESAGPRNIDVETDAGPDAALDRTSGARIEVAVVVSVQGHVEDGGVVVEDLLGWTDGWMDRGLVTWYISALELGRPRPG